MLILVNYMQLKDSKKTVPKRKCVTAVYKSLKRLNGAYDKVVHSFLELKAKPLKICMHV